MQSRKLILILCGLGVLLAFALGIHVYQKQQREAALLQAQAFSALLSRQDAPTYGPATAKVRIVEFFDPACEACRMMYPYVKSLMRANDGKLRLTLRYATFHEGSDYVVKVLEAARMQGPDLYWKALEAILANQSNWAEHGRSNPQLVWDYLSGTGLDTQKAKQDMNDARIAELLKQDAKDLATLKINKTPSFFINGKPLTEFGQNQLRVQVEKEIRATYP